MTVNPTTYKTAFAAITPAKTRYPLKLYSCPAVAMRNEQVGHRSTIALSTRSEEWVQYASNSSMRGRITPKHAPINTTNLNLGSFTI
jgi:hypothetical protein